MTLLLIDNGIGAIFIELFFLRIFCLSDYFRNFFTNMFSPIIIIIIIIIIISIILGNQLCPTQRVAN